jgi:hypothetical protein
MSWQPSEDWRARSSSFMCTSLQMVKGRSLGSITSTFSLPPPMSTIHMVLAMVAQRDWEIHQIDIKSAYLYASIQEEIYIRTPPEYLRDDQHGKVLKLKRSLPRLKWAGYEWAEELAGVFAKLGFSRSRVDQAVYYKCTSMEQMVITVFVNDMAVTSNHISLIKHFKTHLQQFFEINSSRYWT